MKYEVGQHTTDGRPLFGYWASCPTCAMVTRFQTRAVEGEERPQEIEVCVGCGYIRKVSTL